MTLSALLPGELAEHLGFDSGDPRAAETDAYAAAATGLVEGSGRVGPIVVRSFTGAVEAAGGGVVVLPHAPVVSVVSAARDGVTVTTGFTVDPCGPVRVPNARNGELWQVTYTAGRWTTASAVPDDLRLAVLIVGKRLWETQRGNTARPGVLSQDGEPTDTSWLVLPSRAVALLASYQQIPVG